MPLFSIQLCINKIASNKIICQDKLKRALKNYFPLSEIFGLFQKSLEDVDSQIRLMGKREKKDRVKRRRYSKFYTPPRPSPVLVGEGDTKGSNFLEWVLFAEAAEGASGTTVGHLFETHTPSTELTGFFNPLAWDNHRRADIITSPAEAAGLRPRLKGHAYFPLCSPPGKSEGLPIHLFVTHTDTATAEDTPVILHRESDFEQSHAGSNVLGYFHIGSAGNQEFCQHLSRTDYSWGLGLNHHPLSDLMRAGCIDNWFTTIITDLDHTDPASSIRRKVFHVTHRRDVNSKLSPGLEDSASLLYF